MDTLTRIDWHTLTHAENAPVARPPASDLWYRWLHRTIVHLYYSRVTVLNTGHLTGPGPVLFIGTHRNGAVDGFIHRVALPEASFLLSTQLRRSPLGRLFFCGIEVARTADEGETDTNDAALDACVTHLESGGRLFVFPEGTSSLGPHHLPFRSGAARIALRYAARTGRPLRVIPVGIHYECPWAFRSRVELVLGAPVDTSLPAGSPDRQRLGEIRRRFAAALEAVGANFATDAEAREAHRLAYAATLGTRRSYWSTLKALERGCPPSLRIAHDRFTAAAGARRLALHQDVPLFPAGAAWAYATALALLAPPVLAGFAVNLPPLAASWFAARRFADGQNVIALWRILVGVPLFLLWFAIVLVVLALLHPGAAVLYALLTAAALAGWYRLKKLAVTVYNAFKAPALRPDALRMRDIVLREVPAP